MDSFSTGAVLGLSAVALLIYLAPTLTAIRRGHPRWQAIAAVNIILGWTIAGWFAAAIWVCFTPRIIRVFHA